jgi:hypothetical protein
MGPIDGCRFPHQKRYFLGHRGPFDVSQGGRSPLIILGSMNECSFVH